MNSFSDIVARKQTRQAGTESASPFLLRKMESSKSLGTKLALPDENEADDDDRSAITDSLIQGLFQRLPKPNSIWSLDDRARWLRTVDSVFDLVYRAGDAEPREIKITMVERNSD
jgi:hypothetical protein